MFRSSIDVLKRRRQSREDSGTFNLNSGENNNVNLNIHFNNNNVNNFNNYSGNSLMNQDRRLTKSHMTHVNMKKKSTFGVTSKRNSMNIINVQTGGTGESNNLVSYSPKFDFKEFVGNLDLPKFNLDLTPLDQNTLSYNEVIKQLKENNKFLFEVTNEEKNLNDKIKAFNYGDNLIKN